MTSTRPTFNEKAQKHKLTAFWHEPTDKASHRASPGKIEISILLKYQIQKARRCLM